jgi:hypothetical protein
VACGVCLGEAAKLRPYILVKWWLASDSMPIINRAGLSVISTRMFDDSWIPAPRCYHSSKTRRRISSSEYSGSKMIKSALDSLDSTVITQTSKIPTRSLKVLPNSFPPAIQASCCYTCTRMLRLFAQKNRSAPSLS